MLKKMRGNIIIIPSTNHNVLIVSSTVPNEKSDLRTFATHWK